ncbi:hypothetical protein, partial [Methylogaea oryzae]|uniref:hypothetical protein n=1 Tax=Methylogaea oryzae TaxID=1295382 RepID=UPI001C3F36B7
ERCERPAQTPSRAAVVQPGRLAQGPEEKKGLCGLLVGFMDGLSARFPMGSGFSLKTAASLPKPGDFRSCNAVFAAVEAASVCR